ncbi:MAG: hypothetical protein WC629_01670 [Candidatus Paceibacterota bacterium]|jgi:hypothetical protein
MKKNPNNIPKQWFIAFDSSDHYEMVSRGLQEAGESPEGFMTKCPDGESRMTVEIKPEFVGQLDKFTLGGQKIPFLVMTKDLPDGELVFVRVSDPKEIRVSSSVFGIIKGSSLLRKQYRHKKK